jgi:uncharacterized protein
MIMRRIQTLLLALSLSLVAGVASSSAVAQTTQNATEPETEVGDAENTSVLDFLKRPGQLPGEENKPICYNFKSNNKIVKVKCPAIIILAS